MWDQTGFQKQNQTKLCAKTKTVTYILHKKKLYAKHHEDKKLKMSVLKLEAIKLIKEV